MAAALPVALPKAFAATFAAPASTTANATAPRVVVLDWGLLETVIALGITPVGAAEIDRYRIGVGTPPVPAATQDVGLRLAPSLELLQRLSPDLILVNSSQASQRPLLERIAPVQAFDIYNGTGSPYRHSQDATLTLGTLCRCEDAARRLIDDTTRTLSDARQTLSTLAAGVANTAGRAHGAFGRPLYLITFLNEQHVGIYGAGSLFQDVMNVLALTNAWRGATNYWGIGVSGIDSLAGSPDADLLCFDPLPGGINQALPSNRLWQALPPVAAGRLARLPPFWGFGMLPSAARFATLLPSALQSMSST